MNSGTRRKSTAWRAALLTIVAAAAAYAVRPPSSTGEAAPPAPQDLIRIESRLSQLEQRFYSVEASIRVLEQQARFAAAAPGASASSSDVRLLRSEVDTLRQRLAQVECGLMRVDERTLTPAAREARRKATASTADPCRLDPDTPLRPEARP